MPDAGEVLRGAACCLALAGFAAEAPAGSSFRGSCPGGRTASLVAPSLAASAVSPPRQATRAALIESAEADLARGDTAAAIEGFEKASAMAHAADAELGLVRAYLQAGQYRRALAFGAHVAGAHPEDPAGAALYAWLLRAGGQGAYADRVLQDAVRRAPRDSVVAAAARALTAPLPSADALLLRPPWRMAPHGTVADGTTAVLPGARVVSSGVLVDGGRRALVPAARLPATASQRLWVRNGLGVASEAVVERAEPAFTGAGVAVLRLVAPLTVDVDDAPGARDPHPGSPGFVVEYAEGVAATPALPWLHLGFLGSAAPAGEALRRLGIDVPEMTAGAPVFDGSGHLAGMLARGPLGEPLMLDSARWGSASAEAQKASARPSLASVRADVAARNGTPRRAAAPDVVYERALRIALQVLIGPD